MKAIVSYGMAARAVLPQLREWEHSQIVFGIAVHGSLAVFVHTTARNHRGLTRGHRGAGMQPFHGGEYYTRRADDDGRTWAVTSKGTP